MVPGAHDGPTTSDSGSDYDFENFNPTVPLDHILVNRLKKNSRDSVEPVDQLQVVQLLQKAAKKRSKEKEPIGGVLNSVENDTLDQDGKSINILV